MLRRVKQLFKIIADADQELKDIRAKCKHKKFSIKLWYFGEGCSSNCQVCDICGDNLGISDSVMSDTGIAKHQGSLNAKYPY